MKKIIHMSRGEELFVNKDFLHKCTKKFEIIDGNLQYSTAIIKNNKGQIYIAYNKIHKFWQLPAGKVDKGENPETCLIREMNEELGIEISDVSYLGNNKVFLSGMCWQGHFYNINKFEGQIKNMEPTKHKDGIRVDIIKANNLLGLAIKFGDKVIEDEIEIMKERSCILWYNNFILNNEYKSIVKKFEINLEGINKKDYYIQYFDTNTKEYGILEKNKFYNTL